tara:strand:+ start:474 stop:614 length:141 start_codon:yes stop_codon:yes gene_type:complete
MTEVTETQLVEEITKHIDTMDRQCLVDLANNILGTDFDIDSIEWAE